MSGHILQLAETIQTAHINRAPDPAHDINPSTAASYKEPVQLASSPDPSDIPSDLEEDEIPVSVLRPTPRRAQLPPLPDLRFEQSYLASIQSANGWQMVTYITMRDQVSREKHGHDSTKTDKVFTGLDAAGTRRCLDAGCCWLATLEQHCNTQRPKHGFETSKMVVGSQQLGSARGSPYCSGPEIGG